MRSSWPHYVLNMNKGDVLILFDIRRYERQLEALGTDMQRAWCRNHPVHRQWGSPIAKHARHSFRLNIEAPSAWDSSVVTLIVVEALIEAVQGSHWEKTTRAHGNARSRFSNRPRFSAKPVTGK
jgi:DNA-binding MurR/RpiR family transcriptional regulator